MGFGIEPFGKTGLAGSLWRQNLQRHETIECRLPRLINRTHPALADERQDLKLRKHTRDFFKAGRQERRGFRLGGRLGVGALLEQARRTKPSQRSDRQRRSALWTFIFHFGIWFR